MGFYVVSLVCLGLILGFIVDCYFCVFDDWRRDGSLEGLKLVFDVCLVWGVIAVTIDVSLIGCCSVA